MPQQPAGIRWLHVHPDYLAGPGEWELIRLAANWRDGRLPDPGGVQQQAAFTVAAIELIQSVWAKMQAARDEKPKES